MRIIKAKRFAVATSVFLSLIASHQSRATEFKHGNLSKKNTSAAPHKRAFVIHVAEGDWGNARPEEIEIVLNHIADAMLAHFPGRTIDPILVSPSRKGPVVLYQKGPQHQYQVFLAARDKRWGEYIYEFSHELFHVLANYEHHASAAGKRHQWFEEMLCEAASLYMLQEMSQTWAHFPPNPEWAAYATELTKFTDRAFSDPHRRLPKEMSFDQWFEKNGPSLLGNPDLRSKNELIAMLFVPLLKHNANWQAISFLNLNPVSETASFGEYLNGWYVTTPDAHRLFITQALAIFRFRAPHPHEQTAQLTQSAGLLPPGAL